MAALSTSRSTTSRSRGDRGRDVRVAVLVVDALPVVRAGIALLIEGCPEFRLVSQAGNAEDALAALENAPSDCVVIVGLGLEGPHDAFWLIETVRDRFPGCAVIASGARSDAVTISRALLSGAGGFVDKNVDPDEFLESIRVVVRGEMVLAGPPQEWIGTIANRLEAGPRGDGDLTDREREVLSIAAEGLTARQIAERLGVRERTVTTHLSRIYSKLGVRTRIAALRATTPTGWVSDDARH
jgi:DNA-binding NarL/FixJ family response regulator